MIQRPVSIGRFPIYRASESKWGKGVFEYVDAGRCGAFAHQGP